MPFFIFRKSSNAVEGVGRADPTADIDATYQAVIDTNDIPDGADLAVPKIVDGTTVRNATRPESDGFAAAVAADEADADRRQLKAASTGRRDVQAMLQTTATTTGTALATVETTYQTAVDAI